VPATLMRWEGKPDLAEVDELIGRGLPPNFTVLRAGPSMDERLAVNEQHLLTHYLPTGVAPPPPVPQLRNRSPDVERLFFDLPAASILAHANTVGTGRPLLRPRLGSRHGAEDSAHRDDRVAAYRSERARVLAARARRLPRASLARRPSGNCVVDRARCGLVPTLVRA